jgi:molybdate transport system substrate-binding protein
VLGENVRQVLDYVVRGEVEAGFVYLTDALTSNQVEVALNLPDNTQYSDYFSGAIITSSQHIDPSNAFSCLSTIERKSENFCKRMVLPNE